MTTPCERMRALTWGGQLLVAIAADSMAQEAPRQRAAALIERYPSQAQLHDLLARTNALFPLDVAKVIFEAGLLFEALALPQHLNAASRHLMRYAMRHYPSRDAGWHQPEDFVFLRVCQVLAFEDDTVGKAAAPAETLDGTSNRAIESAGSRSDAQ